MPGGARLRVFILVSYADMGELRMKVNRVVVAESASLTHVGRLK